MKRYVTVLLIALVVTVGFSTFTIQPTLAVPTGSQLKTAIDGAKVYIDHLYEIDGVYNYVKEYPAFPLGIYVQETGKWFLVGADYDPPISYYTTIEVKPDYDHYLLRFKDTETGDYNFELDISRFYYTDGSTKYRVAFVRYTGSYTIDLYLGDDKIIPNITSSTDITVVEKWKYNYESYPAHRYTARHGFQLCELIYQIWDEKSFGEYLTNLLEDYGFTYDIYDPLFFESVGEMDQFMFTTQAYHDVDVYDILPRGMNPHRYPYWSKVGINRDLYIGQSYDDPLLRGLWAIHVLNKYNDPDKEFLYTEDEVMTARDTARWIEYYYWNGYGISVPFKDPQYASGVRSAVFLVLETLLGYKYNDATSKSYADSMANVMVQVQWGLDGYGETADLGVILRPPHAGGFLLSWKTGTSYPFAVAPKSFLEEIIDMFAMPSEIDGIIPTNLETTVTAAQALRVYLYYKHGIAYPNKRHINPILHIDDFNDGDYDGWSPADGTWAVENGELSGEYGLIAFDYGWSWIDYTLIVDMKTITAGEQPHWVGWVYFRYKDGNNFYYALIKTDGTLELSKWKSGVHTFLFHENVAVYPTVWHTLKISVKGGVSDTRIKIWVDEQIFVDVIDTDALGRGTVCFNSASSLVHYDNVQVEYLYQYDPILIQDNFDDGDFLGWKVLGGAWSVEYGKLTGDLSGRIITFAGARYGDVPTWSNYKFVVTAKTIDAGSQPYSVAWVMFRFLDYDNYYYALLHTNGYLEVTRVKGGANTFIIWTSTGLSPTVEHTFDIRVSGAWNNVKIEVRIDGTLYGSNTDTDGIASGRIGFYAYDSKCSFDNVDVREIVI